MSPFILLRTTAPDRETAELIANQLTIAKLAASVHITGPIHATYWWENSIHNRCEYLCEARTRRDLKERAIAIIEAAHPYKTPEIFSIALQPETAQYEAWLMEYTTVEES